MSNLIGIDTYIAAGLIITTIVILILSRINLLPKKSLPFVIAAVVGLFGFSILRRKRTKELQTQIKKREEKIKALLKDLDRMKDQYGASSVQLEQIKAELEVQRSAHEKEILNINKKHKAESDRIDSLSGQELHDAYADAFGKQ
jgi:hypothetical protein